MQINKTLRSLTVASVAALALSACGGGGGGDLPLLKMQIKVRNIAQGGACDTVPVRVQPKQLGGPANKYANTNQSVTEVAMTGPVDENGAPVCTGAAETLPLAPGVWEFRAPLASGTVTCEREVAGGGDMVVDFQDGVDGCGGPAAAAPAEAAPADGMVPADGPAPADGTAPAEAAPAPAAG